MPTMARAVAVPCASIGTWPTGRSGAAEHRSGAELGTPDLPALRLSGAADLDTRPATLRWLVAGNVVACVLVAALTVLTLGASRAALRQRALDATDNVARGLEQAIAARIGRIDMALLAVTLSHARSGQDVPLERLLADQRGLDPALGELRAFDAQGRLRTGPPWPAHWSAAGPGAAGTPGLDAAAAAGLIVDEPRPSGAGDWLLPLGRRLVAADGRPDGMVQAYLSGDELQSLLAGVRLGRYGAASVRSAGMVLVARRTEAGAQQNGLGSTGVSPELRTMLQAAPGGGTYVARTALDGVERANAYRRVDGLPLYILVGIATEEYLAPWYPQLLAACVLAVLLCAAIAGGSALAYGAGRRRAELQREQLLRVRTEQHAAELDRLLQERGAMLDVLAHEVRQPLNNASAALQGARAALGELGQSAPAQRLARAQTVLGSVMANIDNTLAVAALLVRDGPVARAETELETLAAVAVGDMPEPERPRIVLRLGAGPRSAPMDLGLMRLALRNLLANALKYGRSGAEVRVEVTDCERPPGCVIDVTSRGAPIPAALVPRLFDQGVRGRHDGGPPGQGLGLYIVRRVMELHGGRAELLANTEEAVTFRLVLPDGD